MTTNTQMIERSEPRRAPRRINGRVPPGCRTLQVIVPETLYYHVQAQASISRLDMADYLVRFLEEAFPVNATSGHPNGG